MTLNFCSSGSFQLLPSFIEGTNNCKGRRLWADSWTCKLCRQLALGLQLLWGVTGVGVSFSVMQLLLWILPDPASNHSSVSSHNKNVSVHQAGLWLRLHWSFIDFLSGVTKCVCVSPGKACHRVCGAWILVSRVRGRVPGVLLCCPPHSFLRQGLSKHGARLAVSPSNPPVYDPQMRWWQLCTPLPGLLWGCSGPHACAANTLPELFLQSQDRTQVVAFS